MSALAASLSLRSELPDKSSLPEGVVYTEGLLSVSRLHGGFRLRYIVNEEAIDLNLPFGGLPTPTASGDFMGDFQDSDGYLRCYYDVPIGAWIVVHDYDCFSPEDGSKAVRSDTVFLFNNGDTVVEHGYRPIGRWRFIGAGIATVIACVLLALAFAAKTF